MGIDLNKPTVIRSMEINRVMWASRRGMLELDLLLQPFVENTYATLDPADQRLYQQLLEEQDQDLYVWLLRRQAPENPDLQRIVQIIRENTGKKST